mmetsp:Transcript_115741/g.310313  ORF Transcript_115741/g.310313 Transcript_115741/m.310313 type:complete len:204 (+) Transcript_115741:214-825(+)
MAPARIGTGPGAIACRKAGPGAAVGPAGRGAPRPAAGAVAAAGEAAPQEPVFSQFAMNSTSACVAAAPDTAPDGLKLVMMWRRLAGLSFASVIFALVASSFHFAINSAMSRSSATGLPPTPSADGAAVGITPARAITGAPAGLVPAMAGLPTAKEAIGTTALGKSGTCTSSSGTGSGDPASRRWALMSVKSIFITSSFHMPFL